MELWGAAQPEARVLSPWAVLGDQGWAGRAARAAELFQGRVAADRAVDPAVQAGSAGPWAAAGRVEVEEDSGAEDQEAAAKVKGSADSGAHNESCASR